MKTNSSLSTHQKSLSKGWTNLYILLTRKGFFESRQRQVHINVSEQRKSEPPKEKRAHAYKL